MLKRFVKYRFVRILLRCLFGVLMFFIALLFFIRSPWGQQVIIGKVVDYVSARTETEVSIDKLFLTFSGNLKIQGLYLEDQEQDTLLYSEKLELSVAIMPLIRSEAIHVKGLNWKGLKTSIRRPEAEAPFNYEFLINAFQTAADSSAQKVSEQSGMPLHMGEVILQKFDLQYTDALTGMKAKVELGQMELVPGALDLDRLDFTIDRLEIADSKLHYQLSKPSPQVVASTTSAKATEGTAFPKLQIKTLSLAEIRMDYQSIPDKTTAMVNLGNLRLRNQQLDLNQQKLSLEEFVFSDSEVFIKQLPTDNPAIKDNAPASNSVLFQWPDWEVKIQKASLLNNQYRVQLTKDEPAAGVFEPEHITLSHADLVLQDVALEPGRAHMELNRLAFVERSGFRLKDLEFNIDLKEQVLSISGLRAATSSNFLSGETTLRYPSLQDFINLPTTASATLLLDSLYLNPKELIAFSPQLTENESFQLLTQKPLSGRLALAGAKSHITLNQLALNWGADTRFSASGTIQNPTDTANLFANIKEWELRSTRADVEALAMNQSSGIELPQSIQLKGRLRGGLHQVESAFQVKTSAGDLDIEGRLTRDTTLAMTAKLQVKELLLHQLLANEQLDTLSMEVDLSASGSELSNVTAQINTRFQKLRFDDYDYSALTIDGDIRKGEGTVSVAYKDRNLDMTLINQVLLDSLAPQVKSLLNVEGADLQALGLTKEPIRAAFTFSSDLVGNADDLRAKLQVSNGQAVYNQESYPIGNFDLNFRATPDTLIGFVKSNVINASIVSNRNIEQLMPALQQQIDHYMYGVVPAERDTVPGGAILQADMTVQSAPILQEVFLQSLERLDTVEVTIKYDQKEQSLKANLLAPHITYQGSEVDSVLLDLVGQVDGLRLNAGWSEINAGSIAVDEGRVSGFMKGGKLDSRLTIFEDTSTFLSIGSAWTMGDTLSLHVSNEDLIFNKENWSILSGNELTLTADRIDVKDFELTNGSQTLTLSDQIPGIRKTHIGALFENYQLANLIGFLNPDHSLANGTVNGSLIVEEPMGVPGLVAGLSINDLEAMEVPLGKLKLNAKALGAEKYDLALGLEGQEVSLEMTGDYRNTDVASLLNFRLNLNSLQTSLVEKFAGGQLAEAAGSISGVFTVNGPLSAPEYQGQLDFNQVSVLVSQLNRKFSIAQEQLKIDNQGLHVKAFTIADGDQNTFDMDGSLLTDELTNPGFDLRLVANNFIPVNATRADSDLFYGKVGINADLKLTGNLQVPKVRGDIQVNEGSEMTVIVPESELELNAREGVVVFVNRENPDDILTRQLESEPSALGQMLAGFDIEMIVNIGRNAVFNIIIDERRGDNLQVKGSGTFNLGLEPNGRTRMSGQYNLSGGHLEVGLYGLVGRKFEITPGSSITWQGNPMDAELDVSALYRITTSAGALMAERTTSDADIEAAYRQKLPFEVYVNVDGMLLQPEISFHLDMPEDERGALGGVVYSQIAQLNAQEEELVKQVFSLLVLGSFYTSKGSDGSAGGPASMAIDNVSSLLENQLNNFSNKLLSQTGVQLGVDVNNRTDQDGRRATSLDISAKKEFFKDRLIVQVGGEVDVAGGQSSSQSTPIIGNIIVEYLITRDRRLRLQGFNRNVYEGVIDGQLSISGIAFIFSKEFNKFRELWMRQLRQGDQTEEDKQR